VSGPAAVGEDWIGDYIALLARDAERRRTKEAREAAQRIRHRQVVVELLEAAILEPRPSPRLARAVNVYMGLR